MTMPLFIPEGHIDRALNRALIAYHPSFDALVNRKQGASGVAHAMKEQWKVFGPTRRVVGLIDNDKKIFIIPYLAEFTREVKRFDAAEAAHIIRQHPAHSSQYLVMLDPACDTWVWQAAVEAGLAFAAYSLPAVRLDFVAYCKDHGKSIGLDPSLLRLLLDTKRASPSLFADLARFVADVMDLTRPLP